MNAPRHGGALGDELTNLGIILLVAAAFLAGILRVAASITAWITHTSQPTGGIETGLGVFLHPADPGSVVGSNDLNPVL